MQCKKCGREIHGTYRDRCEDCWAEVQHFTGQVGIPNLSGLDRWQPRKAVPVDTDLDLLVSGAFARM